MEKCETQEETYRYYKRLGVTALSIIAITACTAAPVVSEMCIAGLNEIFEEVYERDVFLMSYAKTFGLNFLAGAVSVGTAIHLTAKIAGVCCASVSAAYVTYLQYVSLKTASCAIRGFVYSLASDALKKYVNGVNIPCKQITRNALERTLKLSCFGIVSGFSSNAVHLSSEDHSTKKEGSSTKGVTHNTVPVTCNVARQVTEMITETTLGLCTSYVTPYAKRVFQRVLSFIGQSTGHLECIVYQHFKDFTSRS